MSDAISKAIVAMESASDLLDTQRARYTQRLLKESIEALQALQSGEPVAWHLFPSYLIDNCEGDTITEEGLQFALAAMLKDDKYTTPQPVVPEGWKQTATELPPESTHVIGFSQSWVDEDFNPDGIRDCFRSGDGDDWQSCWWNDPCDQYETQAGRTGGHGAPTHWMIRPSTEALLSAGKGGE
jgi:hypothetical protein